MNEAVEAAYDKLPYPSGPHPYSHPGHFGMLAKLAGGDPVSIDHCRVLEIGGSDGGNLMPIAIDFPDSEFVCLDISNVQIEMGRRHAESLGVRNLRWVAADVSQFDTSKLGKFDYIIAHGVYSWVDQTVQDRLLELYAEQLSTRGFGFISYNTYPGWHAHMALREMMLAHIEGIEDGSQRVDAVIDLVNQIAKASKNSDSPIAAVVRSFLNSVNEFESVPVYITHEFLSQDNSPVYFKEFARRSAQVGLQVLGDGNHAEKSLASLSDDSRHWIEQQTVDPVIQNQYLDFLEMGVFRRSILCRADIPVDWEFNATRWSEIYVSANVQPIDGANDRWTTADGKPFTTSHPLAQAILARLSQAWPASVQVFEIATACQVSIDPIAHIIQSMFEQKLVEARLSPHRCIGHVTDQPTASRFSRHQVAGGYVTTQRHGRIRMDDDQAKAVLPMADGTRTVEQIADRAGIPRQDTIGHLEQMAKLGLLVG